MCGQYSYGCANNVNRGNAVCANKLRVPRKIIEERLLAAIKNELFNEEAIELFLVETARLLKQKQSEQRPDANVMRRSLDRAEREIANIMNAIKAGIITPTTKAELDRAEYDRARYEAALKNDNAGAGKLASFLPRAAERYKSLVDSLCGTMCRDVTQSRRHLKTLVGSVILLPMPEGYLEAQLTHSPEGLAMMAGDAGLKFEWLRGRAPAQTCDDTDAENVKFEWLRGRDTAQTFAFTVRVPLWRKPPPDATQPSGTPVPTTPPVQAIRLPMVA